MLAVRRLTNDPQQYIVGGRSFGAVLMWVLMGGEIYTTFTFLGIAGWAYGRGAEAFYLLGYGSLAYVVAYFFLPRLWRFASAHQLLTFGDFFAERYHSRGFGALIAAFAVFLEVMNVNVQLTGLQILLSVAGYGTVNATGAVLIGAALMTIFVFVTGLRGMAWASIVKDALMICCAVFVGVLLPVHFFGSPAAMLSHVVQAKPTGFVLGPLLAPTGKLWYLTTMCLTGLGFFMSGVGFAAVYAGKTETAVRRNTIFLPLYSLMILPIFFAGYTALLIIPGLHGVTADRAYLLVLQRNFPAPVLGVVCAGGCLGALLPSAARMLAGGSLISKNILGDVFHIAQGDVARTWTTRFAVLIMATGAISMWLVVHASLVDLLLFVYNGGTQFAPGALLGIFGSG